MELTDKLEPPTFATCESYGVAIAFACLSDFVLSLVQIDRGIQGGEQESMLGDYRLSLFCITYVSNSFRLANFLSFFCAEEEVLRQLLSSSWPGLLAALNLLLEAR